MSESLVAFWHQWNLAIFVVCISGLLACISQLWMFPRLRPFFKGSDVRLRWAIFLKRDIIPLVFMINGILFSLTRYASPDQVFSYFDLSFDLLIIAGVLIAFISLSNYVGPLYPLFDDFNEAQEAREKFKHADPKLKAD
jgi:hypothetical protein